MPRVSGLPFRPKYPVRHNSHDGKGQGLRNASGPCLFAMYSAPSRACLRTSSISSGVSLSGFIKYPCVNKPFPDIMICSRACYYNLASESPSHPPGNDVGQAAYALTMPGRVVNAGLPLLFNIYHRTLHPSPGRRLPRRRRDEACRRRLPRKFHKHMVNFRALTDNSSLPLDFAYARNSSCTVSTSKQINSGWSSPL